MTEKQNENAWENFYRTGKINDYLACCGIEVKSFPAAESASERKDTNRRIGDPGKTYR